MFRINKLTSGIHLIVTTYCWVNLFSLVDVGLWVKKINLTQGKVMYETNNFLTPCLACTCTISNQAWFIAWENPYKVDPKNSKETCLELTNLGQAST